jgi:hypothetical protein
MKTIAHVVGARPNYMRIAPLVRALAVWVSPSYGVKQPTRLIILEGTAPLPACGRFLISAVLVIAAERTALVSTLCDRSS